MVVNGRINERHDITLDPQTEKVVFFWLIVEVEGSSMCGVKSLIVCVSDRICGCSKLSGETCLLFYREKIAFGWWLSKLFCNRFQFVSSISNTHLHNFRICFIYALPAMRFRHSCVCWSFIKLMNKGYYTTVKKLGVCKIFVERNWYFCSAIIH